MGSKRIARRLPLKPEREELPEHLRARMTLREFKALKRKQALLVERALDDLHIASAFMPHVEGIYLGRILEQIRTARREWSKWWRNA